MLERRGEGAAAPERDRFARACTGVGSGPTRVSVRACVRHAQVGHEPEAAQAFTKPKAIDISGIRGSQECGFLLLS